MKVTIHPETARDLKVQIRLIREANVTGKPLLQLKVDYCMKRAKEMGWCVCVSRINPIQRVM